MKQNAPTPHTSQDELQKLQENEEKMVFAL